MLLKRLPNLTADVQALIPLLEPQVKTTESLILTPRPALLSLILYNPAFDWSDIGEDEVARARLASSVASALDALLAHALARIPVRTGEEIALEYREKGDRGWEGFGVLEDVLDWDGLGVLSIAGARGVGKSLLALHAILRVLVADPMATARWIDTDGAFNAARAKAVLEGMGAEESVLGRLTVSSVFRLEPEFFDVLAELQTEGSLKLLVIDNIAGLFRDALMGSTAQGHAAMVIAMEEVAGLTYEQGITTIVTNSVASSMPTNPASAFSNTSVKPGLGSAFAFTADVELLLQDTGRVFGLADEGERDRARERPGLRILVEVVKSCVSPTGVWGVVETDGEAIYNVDPPPKDDDRTVYRSAGGSTGRPALGGLAQTLEPAIAPLRATRH